VNIFKKRDKGAETGGKPVEGAAPLDYNETERVLQEFRLMRDRLRQEGRDRHPEDNILIGDCTYDQAGILGAENGRTAGVKIGKFSSISWCNIMQGQEHQPKWLSTFPFYLHMPGVPLTDPTYGTKGDIVIGNDVWIGSDAKIMSGVTIGDGCVVAANAVVTKDLPPYTICAGVPARVVKKRFSDEQIARLLEMQWWNWPDEDICAVIPLLQSENFDALVAYYETHREAL
jgi:acetyltransferase-like isoleucine patch superfamily enzyme